MAGACERSGRARSEVELIAVSKTFPAERVRDVLAAGQELFGENRVQEALDKIPRVGPPARWHLLGHLQRNKARHAVGAFELIHGVDGVALAEELNRRAESAGLRQGVLAQVHLGGEASKFGVSEADLPALLERMAQMPYLDLQGLMTLPPPAERPEESRHWFARLRQLRDRAAADQGLALPHLSMGMTGDFEVAIEEGATLVRISRAIFGPRA